MRPIDTPVPSFGCLTDFVGTGVLFLYEAGH